jgi:KUP system potassium uptake protein
MYDASVLKGFSPYFAGAFLVRNGRAGWLQLGGILLAFTGVETLFADLGAFSKRYCLRSRISCEETDADSSLRAVQISWLCFAYPCLLISVCARVPELNPCMRLYDANDHGQYIGQGAHISRVPSAYANPFYLTVPPGMLYPSLVVAVLACIVASQAVITGSFQVCLLRLWLHSILTMSQLLSQIMKLSYFPQVRVYHVSKIFHGQVYIPIANWLMMIGTIIVTAVYNNVSPLDVLIDETDS